MRHLEIIDAEIHRLDRVVQMLVDFSRPVELKLREQDLRSVIGDVLELAAAELSTRNVNLVSRMPSKPLLVNIDADLLKQAVLNVIQNGAQAMPEGGQLEVVLEEERKSGWKTAVLRISDQGPGIPDEIREKIFDLYFTTRSGGSGIGLAMTYRILQLHHGSVEVESKVRPWRGLPAPYSTRCRGMGTPESSSGKRFKLEKVESDEVACQKCRVAAAVVSHGMHSHNRAQTGSGSSPVYPYTL